MPGDLTDQGSGARRWAVRSIRRLTVIERRAMLALACTDADGMAMVIEGYGVAVTGNRSSAGES